MEKNDARCCNCSPVWIVVAALLVVGGLSSLAEGAGWVTRTSLWFIGPVSVAAVGAAILINRFR